MSDAAIATSGLTKRFRSRAVVDALDLHVPRGSVFGFLGPNGSGKTTTIRMLLGLISPSAGSIQVLGEAMPDRGARVLPRVGALVEGPAFAPYLSGTANLVRRDTADRYAPRATRRARVEAALERVGLSHAAGKHVRAYSLGMKQRLGIAGALLTDRDLLVLDEPTNGLDPQGTREVRSLVRSLADEGRTVFVSSHLLAEIEQVCTHAAIMRTGRLVAQGSLDELRRGSGPRVAVETPDAHLALAVLGRFGLDAVPTGPGVEAALGEAAPPAEELSAALVREGVRLRGFAVRASSLEERFVELTGEGFDVEQ
ncbi:MULTISPECIES: ATP-binding cassette domain-containing protein [unclassified Leifsonia]|uniref:ABC transporter ATP-binding protein n=1 Tax=unclassified Leifsonia TaxID=2663824 RepID=UPI0008A7EDAD|nr:MULTISPECIES: ATP-binding cassette domain-containing protein [unclassified Leifsonia]SEH94539.1 ABC-2 type transport system ATP-binding protein [Leifsonia sp. CL154]SFL58566.1 ABC-2 type transport system ATP-binding protein [Leifsonia sp. CL147]